MSKNTSSKISEAHCTPQWSQVLESSRDLKHQDCNNAGEKGRRAGKHDEDSGDQKGSEERGSSEGKSIIDEELSVMEDNDNESKEDVRKTGAPSTFSGGSNGKRDRKNYSHRVSSRTAVRRGRVIYRPT